MKRLIYILFVLSCMTWQMSQAQAFRVSSFGLLETDLTARVHPEKDLNGDACALIKVVMDKHFEFSGPLGIVKRIEKTAEIWLYVPAGTERLTISHPQWGMIRDYLLPMPLKGLATYEMCLEAVKQEVKPSETNPEVSVAEPAKTVVANLSDKDTTTVDSHAVLVAETPLHPSNPSSHFVLQLNAGYSSSLMLGATAAYLSSSVGSFIRYSSNWKSISDSGLSCNSDGSLTNGGGTPYYETGAKEKCFAVLAGPTLKVARGFYLTGGVGYGEKSVYWTTIEGKNIKYDDGSYKGVAAEIGVMGVWKHLSFSASVQTIQMKTVLPMVGIGFVF